MKLARLIILLLTIAAGGSIRSQGRTDSSDICLTPRQFDYLARAVVDRKQLRKDTATLQAIIHEKDGELHQKEIEAAADSLTMVQMDEKFTVQGKALASERKGRQRAEKLLKIVSRVAAVALPLIPVAFLAGRYVRINL